MVNLPAIEALASAIGYLAARNNVRALASLQEALCALGLEWLAVEDNVVKVARGVRTTPAPSDLRWWPRTSENS